MKLDENYAMVLFALRPSRSGITKKQLAKTPTIKLTAKDLDKILANLKSHGLVTTRQRWFYKVTEAGLKALAEWEQNVGVEAARYHSQLRDHQSAAALFADLEKWLKMATVRVILRLDQNELAQLITAVLSAGGAVTVEVDLVNPETKVN